MTVVFYDGVCGLCSRLVQFLLARDRRRTLRFAQLQGTLARRELVPHGFDPADLSTVFVIAGWQTPQQRVLTRSRAILHAAGELGGGWSVLARIASVIPSAAADVVYRVVARTRYRTFGKYDVCPMPTPEWRERFLD